MEMKILKSSLLILVALAAGCAKRADNAAEARADYSRSLSDSIAVIETQVDSCENQITELRDQVNGWLPDFTTVTNPREAGSYIILTSARKLYPLTGTGLVARINDSGQFELIAALASKPFDRISVNGPSVTASSETVPNDQALNYRTPALTTVLFSGERADSIGMLIADNELNPITVTYYQGGAVGSWKIPAENAKMISYTYLLYDTQRRLGKAERRLPMLREKINLLRAHRDKRAEQDSAR